MQTSLNAGHLRVTLVILFRPSWPRLSNIIVLRILLVFSIVHTKWFGWRNIHSRTCCWCSNKLISNLYDNQQACVRTEKGDSDWFNIGQGVRQGCILSPALFNLYAEYIMRRVLENWNGGLSIGGYKLCNLRYADDTTLVATSALELEELLLIVKAKSEALGLRLNVSKTKIMIVGSDGNEDPIVVDGTEVEHVTQFNLGH